MGIAEAGNRRGRKKMKGSEVRDLGMEAWMPSGRGRMGRDESCRDLQEPHAGRVAQEGGLMGGRGRGGYGHGHGRHGRQTSMVGGVDSGVQQGPLVTAVAGLDLLRWEAGGPKMEGRRTTDGGWDEGRGTDGEKPQRWDMRHDLRTMCDLHKKGHPVLAATVAWFVGRSVADGSCQRAQSRVGPGVGRSVVSSR